MTSSQSLACGQGKHSNATCAFFYGQLVAVGGNHGTSGSETPTINAYDAKIDSWYEIGKLASGRSQPLVVQLSEDTLVVVGGIGQTGETVYEIKWYSLN